MCRQGTALASGRSLASRCAPGKLYSRVRSLAQHRGIRWHAYSGAQRTIHQYCKCILSIRPYELRM